MEKKIKKRIKIKILPLLIAIIVCILLYFGYMWVSDLPIKNIYIQGNSILTDQEVIELAKLENYPSFFKNTNKILKKRLKESPYIESVSIKRNFFQQITINVTENIPYFINTEKRVVLSNQKEIINDRNLVLPTLINYTPDTKYQDLIEKIGKIQKEIWSEVSEIKYKPTDQDKDRFAIYMDDGNLVYLTLTKFTKLNYYNEIVVEFNCERGILNLDSGNHFEIKTKVCE